jgi:chorismate mutase
VWLRLVKAGIVQDPELLQGIQEKALVRKQAAEVKAEAAKKPTPAVAQRKAKALKAARKLVAENQSELDGLESDAVDEQLSKIMAKRLALQDTTTDAPSSSDSDDPERKAPVSRIRLKSQPIPIPSRRAALRRSLNVPVDSDAD